MHKVRQAILARRARRVLRVPRALKVIPALKALKAIRVQRALKGIPALKVLPVPKARLEAAYLAWRLSVRQATSVAATFRRRLWPAPQTRW